MGANMRRIGLLLLLLLLSVFFLAGAIDAADAQTTQPLKRNSVRQKAAQKPATPPQDTRPRFKRDDTPAPVVTAAPPKPTLAPKKRTARKPADGAQPAAAAAQIARASVRDVAACAQTKDH